MSSNIRAKKAGQIMTTAINKTQIDRESKILLYSFGSMFPYVCLPPPPPPPTPSQTMTLDAHVQLVFNAFVK